MEVMTRKENMYICPECEGKMYLLPGSLTSIYVCRDCGCSADSNSNDIKNGEIRKKLEEESNNESLQKGKNCISSMFTHSFMKKYTKFESIKDFLSAGGLLPRNVEQITFDIFKKIQGYKLDQYVKNNTRFSNWDEMFDAATGRYLMI
jgi:hypothetical protein